MPISAAALRMPPGGPIAATEPTPPVLERSPLRNEDEGYSFDGYANPRDFEDAPYIRGRRRRRLNSSLLVGTAKSFADAFEIAGATRAASPGGPASLYYRIGAGVYVANMHIINDDLPKRGEEISFLL